MCRMFCQEEARESGLLELQAGPELLGGQLGKAW
jgi:hypothetical protein